MEMEEGGSSIQTHHSIAVATHSFKQAVGDPPRGQGGGGAQQRPEAGSARTDRAIRVSRAAGTEGRARPGGRCSRPHLRGARARHRPTTLLSPRLPRRENGKAASSARRASDWPPPPALLPIGRLAGTGGVRLAGALLVPNSKFFKVPGKGGRALLACGTRRLQRCR